MSITTPWCPPQPPLLSRAGERSWLRCQALAAVVTGSPASRQVGRPPYGKAAAVRAGRAQVLDAVYLTHPERFVSKPPAPPKLPGTSWINPPQEKEGTTQ